MADQQSYENEDQDYNLQYDNNRHVGASGEDWGNTDTRDYGPPSTREDSGIRRDGGSSYIKTSEGYVFPSVRRHNDRDRDRGNDYDRYRSRRRRSRSRSRSRDRDRRSSSSSYSRDRDRSDRHRDRDRDRSWDRDREDRGRDRGDRDRRRYRYDEDRPRDASWDDDEHRRDSYGRGSNYGDGLLGNYGDQFGETDVWPGEEYDTYDNNRSHEEDGTLGNKRINGKNWKDRLTSIREAHFNRSKQPPSIAQNQFQNDGSFMEMFKKKMQQQNSTGEDNTSVTPNSLYLASQSIPFGPELSLPPLTTSISQTAPTTSKAVELEDVDGTPMVQKSLPMPVSVRLFIKRVHKLNLC